MTASVNYWLTTHWPPRPGDTHPVASHIFLPVGRETDGRDLREGDHVVVYQSKTGPTRRRVNAEGRTYLEPCAQGRGGVLALCEVTGPLARDPDSSPEEYTSGPPIHWAFRAPLKVLSMSGHLPRERLNPLLGYDPTYMLRGIGRMRSGLKQITEAEFEQIATAFLAGRPATTPALPLAPPHPGPGGCAEGEPHRRLKAFVAGAPEAALGEPGLTLLGMEHGFPTGDRADVALCDRYGRVLGVEIEVHVADGEIVGFLQALKYAVMLEPVYDRHPGDRRALLVAYSISKQMRELCGTYDVECVVIPEASVDAWHAVQARVGQAATALGEAKEALSSA